MMHGDAYLAGRAEVASDGLVPEGDLQRVQARHLELLVVLDRIDLLTVEGLMDDVVDRAPVCVPQLVGDVLVGASFGRQLDGARVPDCRQCSVPVTTGRAAALLMRTILALPGMPAGAAGRGIGEDGRHTKGAGARCQPSPFTPYELLSNRWPGLGSRGTG